MYSSFNSKFSTLNLQSREHLDSGKYELIKRILHWTIAELRTEDTLDNNQLAPLQPHYFNSDEYYTQFKPLIIEEAKTIIKEGFTQVSLGKAPKATVKAQGCIPAKATDNPSLLIMDGRLPDDSETTQAVVVLLKSVNGYELFGIASASEQDEAREQFKIKFLLNYKLRANFTSLFSRGTSWDVYVLGSVLSQIRAYEACTQKPNVPFIYACIMGRPGLQRLIPQSSLQSSKLLAGLNPVQQRAIVEFVQLSQGLQLLQGPPGTGKTTTVVTLLKALCLQNQRILVCAPSNKAVQVLAKRFFQTCPDISAALAGIEKKVPAELQPIFIHTWAKQILSSVKKIEGHITQLKQQGGKFDISTASQRIEKIRLAYQAIVARISTSTPSLVVNEQLTFNQLADSYIELLGTAPTIEDSEIRIQNVLHKLIVILRNLASPISQATQSKDNNLETLLLNHARVIFTTLSVAGRDALKKMRSVDVLIVDEAAQAIEAETLIAFQHQPKKCLLVGDTKQLPALVKSPKAVQGHLDWSMMWRLMEVNHYPYHMLTVQYRMQPEIRNWPSQQYYANQLEDGPNIIQRNLPQLPSLFLPYAFIDINTKESLQGFSYTNEKEADYIVQILQYLKKNHQIDVEKRVGIISFYAGQVELIQSKLKRKQLGNVLVNSVDGYQGDECDFIIISFVRANARNSIGFLNDFRRLNVAITRAKLSLIMLGNRATLSSAASDIKHLLANAQERCCLYDEQHLLEIIKETQLKKVQANKQQKTSKSVTVSSKSILKNKPMVNLVQPNADQQPTVNSTKEQPQLKQVECSSRLFKNKDKPQAQFFKKTNNQPRDKYPQAKRHFDKGWIEESLGKKCKDNGQKSIHYTNAITHYTKAIEIHPPYHHALQSRGYLKAELGSITKQAQYFQEAIQDHDAAIALKSDFAKSYVNRGWSKGELGALTGDISYYHSAIEDLNKAIELEPDNASAYRTRAWNKGKAGLDGKADKKIAAKLKSQKYNKKPTQVKKQQDEVERSSASSIKNQM